MDRFVLNQDWAAPIERVHSEFTARCLLHFGQSLADPAGASGSAGCNRAGMRSRISPGVAGMTLLAQLAVFTEARFPYPLGALVCRNPRRAGPSA